MKRIFLAGLFLLILLIEPKLADLRTRELWEEPGLPTAGEFALRFLGEIRYTLAAYLWLKVEIYHHELEIDFSSHKSGLAETKKIGEILSICRIVTRLDPHFVQAYDVGAWRLAESLGEVNQAIDFLNEGLKTNPENALLNDDLGQIYFFLLKDCERAVPYLEMGARKNKEKVSLGIDLRILGHCYEKENRTHDAIHAYWVLERLFPDDPLPANRLKLLRKLKS